MMRALLLLFPLLALITVSGIAQDGSRPLLDASLEAARIDIETRNPHMAVEIRQALARNPEKALEHLRAHARYLEELREAEVNEPEKYRLFVEQDRMESEVRSIVVSLGPSKEASAEQMEALRTQLQTWFEVRQELRTYQATRLRGEAQAQRIRLEGAVGRDELVIWIARITEGGAPDMRRRLTILTSEESPEALLPAVIEVLMQFDPASGHDLATLAEAGGPEAFDALRNLASERPELIAEAKRRHAPTLEVQKELRAAIAEAHRILIPQMEGRAHGLSPDDLTPQATAQLHAVVAAERAVGALDLAQVESKLDRQFTLLAERTQKKALIVELQLARLLERYDLYEW